MYCKFCGSRIKQSADRRCAACGAKIDLTDGGQTFYNETELDVWLSGSENTPSYSDVPKTEMREYEPHVGYGVNDAVRDGGSDMRRYRPRKKKKKLFGFIHLSSSSKLIIFCIASVLAIVLLAVAIIAVLHGGNGDTETDGDNNAPQYTQQAEQGITAANEKKDAERQRIDGITVYDENGEKIKHSVPAYIDSNNTLYLSIDRILRHKGYKDGRENGDNKKRVVYEHKNNGKVIEIEKDTNKVWIGETGKEPQMKSLDSDCFNMGNETYIPIKSFLELLGYDTEKVGWVEKDKEFYFKK